MPFENERITAADYALYQLALIDKRYQPMSNCSSQWTIDRERNVHMRCVTRTVPPEMGPHAPFWLLFWKTAYVIFEKSYLQHATRDNNWSAHAVLTRLEIPEQLLASKNEIIKDIEAALRVYGTGGIYCSAENFQLRFDVSAITGL
jgi:hypothetical protein